MAVTVAVAVAVVVSSQVRLGTPKVAKAESLWISEAGCITGQMRFLSPSNTVKALKATGSITIMVII